MQVPSKSLLVTQKVDLFLDKNWKKTENRPEISMNFLIISKNIFWTCVKRLKMFIVDKPADF